MDKLKIKIIAVSLLSGVAGIWFGYGGKNEIVKTCESTVERYVLAHFSESYMATCSSVDANGNAITEPCTQTRYWTKPASKVNKITVVNKPPEYPEMPKRRDEISKSYHFDYFREYTDTSLTVYTDKSFFEEPISKSDACISKIDNMVNVKTWYGVPYSSDFLASE